MELLVGRVLTLHVVLSSGSALPNTGLVAHACYPVTPEMETGKAEFQFPSGSTAEDMVQWVRVIAAEASRSEFKRLSTV